MPSTSLNPYSLVGSPIVSLVSVPLVTSTINLGLLPQSTLANSLPSSVTLYTKSGHGGFLLYIKSICFSTYFINVSAVLFSFSFLAAIAAKNIL